MAGVRIKVNSAGMRALLCSGEVRGELTRRMSGVLSAAQAGDPERTYRMVQGTTDRARVSVGSNAEDALYAETASGNLARALDAAG